MTFENCAAQSLTIICLTAHDSAVCHLSPPPPPLQILERLHKMCSSGVWKKQQRLLKNMGAHKVMLDLLQVSYDKVRPDTPK